MQCVVCFASNAANSNHITETYTYTHKKNNKIKRNTVSEIICTHKLERLKNNIKQNKG